MNINDMMINSFSIKKNHHEGHTREPISSSSFTWNILHTERVWKSLVKELLQKKVTSLIIQLKKLTFIKTETELNENLSTRFKTVIKEGIIIIYESKVSVTEI